MRQFIPIAAVLTLAAGSAGADNGTSVIGTSVVSTTSQIEVTLANAGEVHASMLTLRDSTTARSAAVRATSVRTFADGDEPVAIAFVYNGQEIYIGNDDLVPEEDPSRYIGVIRGLSEAIQHVAARRFPHGSQAALISYADRATVRLPMSSIAHLRDNPIGRQKDYYGTFGTDLVSGIDTGLRELELSHAAVKLLVVIGDGNDTNNEAARGELADLKRRAARDKIETFALIYKGVLSEPGRVISTMIPTTRTVASFEHMAGTLDAFLAGITDRSYVTFSGESLAWDGREHALTIGVGGEDLDAEYVELPLHARASPWFRSAWWQQLGAGLGAVLLLALALRLRFGWKNPV